ncbi:MAG: serine hydrolase domain-containing protein [Pseudomonadota bacterium]
MFRATIIGLIAFIAVIAWNGLVFLGVSEGWGKSPIVNSNKTADFMGAFSQAVEADTVGNLSMVLIKDGEIAGRFNTSIGNAVDGSSVYQVASLGKWITAWGVMVLVEEGLVDLDTPVSEYLTRWRLPDSEFDSSGVTIRRLLSHTSGLGDGLGYDGFKNPNERQSLEDSLKQALDASPGKSGVVELSAEPGSQWSYSGGGYTVLQMLIEDVSGQSFADFMSTRVFNPLGMNRTTFSHSEALQLGLAENYDLNGETEPFRWYTALAATSLFTSADDLALFIQAQTETGRQPVLSEHTLKLMRTPHASQMGADIWGLGPMLYAPNNGDGHIIGHDGNNGPAINTVARFDPATRDGIVILSTGSNTLATRLAGEWVFWKTGNIDSLMFLMSFNSLLLWMGVGSTAIILLAIVAGLRSRQPRRHVRSATSSLFDDTRAG